MVHDLPPMTVAHGNPTLALPPRHRGGRVLVRSGMARVWQSHDQPADTGAVRVDVWDGHFVESARGWSVLSAGTYRAAWVEQGAEQRLAELTVDATRVFAARLETGVTPPLLTDGRWLAGPHGLAAADGRAWLFREGPAHGELEGIFVADGTLTAFGLIARHYNNDRHLRVTCEATADEQRLALVGQRGQDLETIAAVTRPASFGPIRLRWSFNGARHELFIADDLVLEGMADWVGAVDVVGLFAEPGCAAQSFAQTTTRQVPAITVERDTYRAAIRPGNVHELAPRRGAAALGNVCWDSGIQFGHIGGSEIKFTQGAVLRRTDHGPVADVVTWHGPMPRFVDQSQDVRGDARGCASFYPDRIVISDEVAAWTQRSVGPDVDLLGRLMSGPARVVFGPGHVLRDWCLPADGTMSAVVSGDRGDEVLPAALIFPLRLAGETWWLQVVVHLHLPRPDAVTCSAFAWQCPRGLTASHDLRVLPPIPGQTYVFEILAAWHPPSPAEEAEQDVLNLRDDWCAPMEVEAQVGSVVDYPVAKDQPREAMDFEGCFDRSTGRYVLAAADGRIRARFDPRSIRRRALALTARGLTAGGGLRCLLDGKPLDPAHVAVQPAQNGETWLWIDVPIDQPVTLELQVAR